jgi:hypothetical protein
MDWREEKGRLLVSIKGQRAEIEGWPAPAREAGLSVLDYAEQSAAEGRRRVTATDLRHGCNRVATAGRTESSGKMSNQEVNRVAVLFKLLRDPDNLDAVMEWLHPENADRRSLLSFMRKVASEPALVAIARNAFGTVLLEELEEEQLRWILKNVKGRRPSMLRGSAAAEDGRTVNGERGQDARATAGGEEPF